jgi:hypothetical protein
MKFGYEELTQGVRLNDISTDGLRQSLPEIAAEFDVDMASLAHVANQRALMVLELLARQGLLGDSPVRKTKTQAAVASAFLDGFFCALNAMRQQGDLDKA